MGDFWCDTSPWAELVIKIAMELSHVYDTLRALDDWTVKMDPCAFAAPIQS
jgi:hypothetical protein